jgi:hypothetical protein
MDTIEMLEKMGENADLRCRLLGDLAGTLDRLGLEPSAKAAFLADDPHRLEEMLGLSTICGALFPAEEEAPEDEGEGDGDEMPDSPLRGD